MKKIEPAPKFYPVSRVPDAGPEYVQNNDFVMILSKQILIMSLLKNLINP